MQNPVEITLRGIPHSAALERFVGEEARKLDRVCERIAACHVAMEQLRRDKRKGAQLSVRLNISLPGKEFVVNREHDEDIYIALRDAFAAAGRQLKEHLRRAGAAEQRSNGQRSRNAAPGRAR